MSFAAYRWEGFYSAEQGKRGSNAAPFSCTPSPALPGRETAYSRKNIVFPSPNFRLVLHWNQKSFSGSSRVGMKSRFQAHFWIGICWVTGKSRVDIPTSTAFTYGANASIEI